MDSPVATAVVYAVVGSVVVLGVLRIVGTRDNAAEIVGSCVAGAATSMIPTMGGPVSLLVTLGLLHWRSGAGLRDVAFAVVLARLAMVPVLLAVRLAH